MLQKQWTIYQLLFHATNSSSDDVVVMENVSAHNFLTLPDDFNAKLGPDDANFYFPKRN